MSEQQRQEVEKAREQARLSAEKFEKVFQATEPTGRPRGPIGPPPEARKHVKIPVEKLEGFKPEPKPQRTRTRTVLRTKTRTRVVRVRDRSREPIFLRRSPAYKSAPLGEAPARITPAEKRDVLHRLERKISKVNHKYAFQIKHGGTPEQKQRTKIELQTLENEHKSVERMHPVPRHFLDLPFTFTSPGHVRRAEREK